jgi:septum formation protein
MRHVKILLGSQSPRRHQLLTDLGYDVEIKVIDVDETFPNSLPSHKVAEYIASKKADAYSFLDDGIRFIITADSIVVLNEEIFGKPKDFEDALKILNNLQGKTHMVYTGVSIQRNNKRITFTEVATVQMASMNEEEIRYYLESAKPFDKAGSYGIQDWIGLAKVIKIDGTFANIMGLPVHKVYEIIQNWRN